jgi:quercetin dioxygenase-like cupin family protein
VTAFDHVDTLAPLAIWSGVVGRALPGEQVTLALIELEPDSVVPEHRHANEQVGILLRGSLRFRIGDDERELLRGATWSIPAHAPHEVHTGPEGATLVEAFAPARDDWASLDRLDPGPPRLF